jgi:general stress protein 26
MKIEQQRNEDMDKLAKLVASSGTGMLTTIGDDGKMSSRPMMPLQMDANGSIWFFTHRESKDDTFIALSGSSELLRDQSKIDELWNPIVRTWFKDKNDPELALLRVDVDGGEYWNSSSSSMVRFAAHVVSAVVGREIGIGSNVKVQNV